MLRFPVKMALMLSGAFVCILGIHALYVYFSIMEAMLSDPTKLFFQFDMPRGLSTAVEWSTAKGLQSWFIPGVMTIAGASIALAGATIDTNHHTPRWANRMKRKLW